jgi:hypothetical protein
VAVLKLIGRPLERGDNGEIRKIFVCNSSTETKIEKEEIKI